MSQYFTSSEIFTNNYNLCRHSEVIPATIYLERLEFLIHKLSSLQELGKGMLSLYLWVSLAAIIPCDCTDWK